MKFNASVVLLALCILLAPVVWHISASQFGAQDQLAALRMEVDALRHDLVQQQVKAEAMSQRLDGLDSRTALSLTERTIEEQGERAEPSRGDSLRDVFAQVVLIANRRNVNDGLTVASPTFLKEFLGLPREELSDDCEEMTNETLAGLLEYEDVGPIKVRLLRPAIISMRQVFRNVQVYEPELYARIQSAGSLCVRRIRGSDEAASSHAYGLAVDLNIDGELDTLGDGKTQLGLTILADFFKQEGWIWGAAYGREDSMHFEVSREKLEQWRRLGEI